MQDVCRGKGYKNGFLADIPLLWMTRRPEAAGLVIDWICLPSRTDPAAPAHNSFSGLFALGHIRPTLRDIDGQKCDVAFNESLHSALD